MAFEECLRFDLWTIGQQGDAKEVFLAGKVDGVFEQLRAVAVIAKRFMDDKVLQQNNEAALRCADGKEQINHPYDGVIASENKNTSAVRLLENQSQPAQLFLLVRPEIALFTEKLAEQIGQFVQVFGRRRLNDDMVHLASLIIENGGSGNSPFFGAAVFLSFRAQSRNL